MTYPWPPPGWTVLVLAGGRGSRLGNDDKAATTIGGASLFDRLLSSIPAGVPVVVAGPQRPTNRPVTFRREWPLHGGPVAGIARGLEAVSTPVTALVAVDMPWAGELLAKLIAEFGSCAASGLVPVDTSGIRQPLCAVFRTQALRSALGQLGDPQGRSLRDLVSLVDVQERPLRRAEMGWVQDIDTPADLERARSTQAQLAVVTSILRADQYTNNEQGAEPTMHTWIDAVCAELNLPADINVDVILDVARVAAHSVERTAAPVTTYLLGSAVARGMDVNEAVAKVQELAAAWATPAP
jgi:molybdopterin-guanine dinucleotide biosynthesis protein A